ncbi:MAG TPA: CvpA family protein [Verrucomicrobiae bacterium]|jgi:uncharacterized membrane protein required for colicin V production
MTIWVLALILWLFCALLGHKQGAIRAAISFVGIIISALLAWPLSGLVARVWQFVFPHPIAIWILSPIVAFLVLLIIFKWVGFEVHRRVRISYQYARDELRMVLWRRVNQRVGLAIGFLNAFLYLVLISVPIYNLSYWTTQIAPSDQEGFCYRLLNRMGNDLDVTGMAKIACAIDPVPNSYFKLADFVGLLRQNPQLADRLAAYPPFLPLSERDDFKTLAGDTAFLNTWQTHGPFTEIWNDAQILYLRQSKTTTDMVRKLVNDNLDDLTAYLHTGQSARYDSEPILGRWDVNIVKSLHLLLQTRANVPSTEMAQLRALWNNAYAKTVFVAASDNEVFLDNFPQFTPHMNQPPTFTPVNLQGTWQSGDNYEITLAGNGLNKAGTGMINDSELTLKMGSDQMVLEHVRQ